MSVYDQEVFERPCEGCGGESSYSEHTCPLAEEMTGSTAECNCCARCEHDCAMDI